LVHIASVAEPSSHDDDVTNACGHPLDYFTRFNAA
jgi:hypothetical protein